MRLKITETPSLRAMKSFNVALVDDKGKVVPMKLQKNSTDKVTQVTMPSVYKQFGLAPNQTKDIERYGEVADNWKGVEGVDPAYGKDKQTDVAQDSISYLELPKFIELISQILKDRNQAIDGIDINAITKTSEYNKEPTPKQYEKMQADPKIAEKFADRQKLSDALSYLGPVMEKTLLASKNSNGALQPIPADIYPRGQSDKDMAMEKIIREYLGSAGDDDPVVAYNNMLRDYKGLQGLEGRLVSSEVGRQDKIRDAVRTGNFQSLYTSKHNPNDTSTPAFGREAVLKSRKDDTTGQLANVYDQADLGNLALKEDTLYKGDAAVQAHQEVLQPSIDKQARDDKANFNNPTYASNKGMSSDDIAKAKAAAQHAKNMLRKKASEIAKDTGRSKADILKELREQGGQGYTPEEMEAMSHNPNSAFYAPDRDDKVREARKQQSADDKKYNGMQSILQALSGPGTRFYGMGAQGGSEYDN